MSLRLGPICFVIAAPLRVHRPTEPMQSYPPPGRLCRIDQLHVDRAETEDGDHGRIALTLRHTIVMRTTGSAFYLSAWADRDCVVGQEIVSAIDPPGTGNNHADPVGCICVGCTEPARIPLHHHQVWAGLIEITIKHGHFATPRWQVTPRLERYLVVWKHECFMGIRRSGLRDAHSADIRSDSRRVTAGDRCE
jgi:hypothetical protein